MQGLLFFNRAVILKDMKELNRSTGISRTIAKEVFTYNYAVKTPLSKEGFLPISVRPLKWPDRYWKKKTVISP
jgi:hypothetical protein